MFQEGLFRTYNSIFLYLFKATDLGLLLLSMLVATWLTSIPFDFFLSFSCFVAVSFVFMRLGDVTGLYSSRRTRGLPGEITLLASIGLLSYALALVIAHIGLNVVNMPPREEAFHQVATWLGVASVLHLGLLLPLRIIFRNVLRAARKRGFNQRHILLVGSEASNWRVAQKIQRYPEYGLQVRGQVYPSADTTELATHSLPLLGNLSDSDLKALCQKHGVDQVWLTTPVSDTATVEHVLKALEHQTVSVRHALDFSHVHQNASRLTGFQHIPLLDIDVSPLDGATSRLIKVLQDKLFAAIALLLAGPFMLIIALGVKLSSPGPVFYRQKRMTWNNHVFEMLKFRTMPMGSDSTHAGWSSKNKGKTNAFTAFLRATSLDELPQLINVLKGDMSMVGPRPERPEYIEQFKQEIPRYMKKHMVKAGITGWAQVNGLRGDTDLTERIEHDLYYIRNWSPAFDIYILFQTVFKGFVSQNAY